MARAMRVGGGEPEGHPGDESDLGVDRFDPAVGQAVLDRGEDRGLVLHDRALELDERVDPAAACPADPVSRAVVLGLFEAEDGPEPFLEQVGAVQAGMGLGDPGELGLLPLGEVLGVLPQRVAGLLQRLDPAVARPARVAGRAAGGVPGLPADLVEGVGGPLHDMERVRDRTALGQRSATTVAIQSAPSALTWLIWAQRLGAESVEEAV